MATTPAEQYAKILGLVRSKLQPGWREEFVEPPWRGQTPKCRGCGRDPAHATSETKFSMSPILRSDGKRKIVQWTVALTCEACTGTPDTMNRLAVEAFLPLLPPGSIPKAKNGVNAGLLAGMSDRTGGTVKIS
jgi:hypothetical protein